MFPFSTSWKVEGISAEAREAANRAASSNGEDVGVWMGRLIRRVSAVEMSASAPAVAEENAVADGEDTKLTSIERAMLRPDVGGMTGNLGSA